MTEPTLQSLIQKAAMIKEQMHKEWDNHSKKGVDDLLHKSVYLRNKAALADDFYDALVAIDARITKLEQRKVPNFRDNIIGPGPGGKPWSAMSEAELKKGKDDA